MEKGTYLKTAECDMIYWHWQRAGDIAMRKVREESSSNGDKSCIGCGG